MPNLPFNFASYDITPRRVAPALGEHNVEVATELGFSDDDLADMQLDGVLFAARPGLKHAPPLATHPAFSRNEKGPS
jgi:hypothetical protein